MEGSDLVNEKIKVTKNILRKMRQIVHEARLIHEEQRSFIVSTVTDEEFVKTGYSDSVSKSFERSQEYIEKVTLVSGEVIKNPLVWIDVYLELSKNILDEEHNFVLMKTTNNSSLASTIVGFNTKFGVDCSKEKICQMRRIVFCLAMAMAYDRNLFKDGA